MLTLPDEPDRDQSDRHLGDDDPGGGGEGRDAAPASFAGTSRPRRSTEAGGVRQPRALLVEITVRLAKKKRAEDAANAIAQIVQRDDDVALRDAVDLDLRQRGSPTSTSG